MKKLSLFIVGLLIASQAFAAQVATDAERGRFYPVSGTVSGAGPSDATYITQTTNSTLSAEQAIGSLSSGIMRVATTTGVITALTDSAGIAANISDETGSGVLVFGTAPTLSTIELGAASTDTTFARVSAGVASIEGSNIITASTEASRSRSIDLLPGSAILPDGSASNLAPAVIRFQGTESSPKKHFLALAFDGAGAQEEAFWNFRVPANYGTAPAVKIAWISSGTTNNVKWQAQLACVTPADADTPLEHAQATAATTTTAVNATEAYRLTETSIDVSSVADSCAAGDFITIHIFRNSGDAADTSTADANMIDGSFTYTTA